MLFYGTRKLSFKVSVKANIFIVIPIPLFHFFFFFHVENKALAFGITSQLHFIPEVTEPLEQLVACKCAEQEPDHKQKHTWSLIG